jgi:uncharacterized membrane protein YraQ (UPF0718 family)
VVKWNPYFYKAIDAASSHSLGQPIAGEIPIVQILTAAGLGPLGAGVLFTTLPAISVPSLVMAGWAFLKRVLASLALWVALMGLLTGLVALAFGLS